MIHLKKLTLTLVALFAMTTGAWAQTEELLTTITMSDHMGTIAYSPSGRATLSTSGTVETGMVVPEVFGWSNSSPLAIGSVTINPAGGYTITKVVFWDYDLMEGYRNALTDNASPFTCYLKSSQRSLNENMSSPNGYAIAKIEVYGYASTVAVTGVTLSPASGELTAGGAALELTPTVAPEGATDKTVKWSVTQTGDFVALYTDQACTQAVGTAAIAAAKVYVKPLAAGQATVTVTTNDGAKTSTCAVTVAEPAPAGTALTPDATRTVWTLAAMPAGNVELQVAYFPGMLVKPTSLVGGTMEIEGVTDTALPDGFEKDDAGNIYVEAGKKFTVKAVPATGYHLVGWSDDATIKDLEREFTMPADGSDFTVTATFSDEFELTFDDVNFKTNQNITVKVGDADKTLDQDGKLSVKAGQTVTLTAKQGYKFRSVEAKKAGAATALSPALENGATVVINYVFNNYPPTVFTFTNNNGTYSCNITGQEASNFTGSLTLNGSTLTFSAVTSRKPDNINLTIDFDTASDTYSFTKKGNYYNSHTVSVNGTDITSQLTEKK